MFRRQRRDWSVTFIEPENLGFLYFDKFVSEAVNSGMPYIMSRPRLRISGCTVDMVNRLGYF